MNDKWLLKNIGNKVKWEKKRPCWMKKKIFSELKYDC